MNLTKLQLSELMCKHAAKGNGLHDLMEIMLESMMVAERDDEFAKQMTKAKIEFARLRNADKKK